MSTYKTIISVRTPMVQYEKQTDCNLEHFRKTDYSPDSFINSRTLFTPTKILSFPASPQPLSNFSCNLDRSKSKAGKLVLSKPRIRKRNYNSIDHGSDSQGNNITQICLRYKCRNKSTEVKILKRKMQSNDALIIERIPTPSNLYIKEVQAFTASRHMLKRNKRLSSIRIFKVNTNDQFK